MRLPKEYKFKKRVVYIKGPDSPEFDGVECINGECRGIPYRGEPTEEFSLYVNEKADGWEVLRELAQRGMAPIGVHADGSFVLTPVKQKSPR